MNAKILIPMWIFGSALLFLYSYTQVDLSLTLSQASIFQTVQKSFQYVGWFNRPLSTYLYIGLFVGLFILYFATLQAVSKKLLTAKQVWIIVLLVTGILTFSYNAFSYDLFNYIFDARIASFYHQNPYIHKALDFPMDPMLSFMRWTHRVYPYGPVWLGGTVPLTFIASEIFMLALILFKLLMAGFFLLTAVFIGKIARQIKLSNVLFPVVFFALNPLVLTESLVSAHNDIVMMGLSMVFVYYLFNKSYVKGVLFLLLSIGIKFATAFLVFPSIIYLRTRKYTHFLYIAVFVMALAIMAASLRTNFQPWYLLFIFPFVSLLTYKKCFTYPMILMSIMGVFYYVLFLFNGNWDEPIATQLNMLVLTTSGLSIILAAALYIKDLKR